MSKNIVLFSGQGSQYAGMAKDFYDNYECAKAVFAAADEALASRILCNMYKSRKIKKSSVTSRSRSN